MNRYRLISGISLEKFPMTSITFGPCTATIAERSVVSSKRKTRSPLSSAKNAASLFRFAALHTIR